MKIKKRDTKRIAAVWAVVSVVFIQLASGQNLPPAGAVPVDRFPLPYESHENQLIRTNFFNTTVCYRQLSYSASRSELLAGHECLDSGHVDLLFVGLRETCRSNIDLNLVDGAREWEG